MGFESSEKADVNSLQADKRRGTTTSPIPADGVDKVIIELRTHAISDADGSCGMPRGGRVTPRSGASISPRDLKPLFPLRNDAENI
jgi:hypothetical protein